MGVLANHVPRGLVVRAGEDDIYVEAGTQTRAGSSAPAILDDPEGWSRGQENELLETVTVSTLSGVQDAISEAQRAPWPLVPGSPSAMPYPNARVADNLLHAWFGDEERPVLRLDPIPLEDLGLNSPVGPPVG